MNFQLQQYTHTSDPDYLQYLTQCELSYYQTFSYSQNQKSKYLPFRKMLINYIRDLVECCGLSDLCLFTAANIIDDAFAKDNNILSCQYQVLCLCSVLIAGKFLDQYYHPVKLELENNYEDYYSNENYSLLQSLLNESEYKFNVRSVLNGEIMLLNKINWRLCNIVTPIHFLDYYLTVLSKNINNNDFENYASKTEDNFQNIHPNEDSLDFFIPFRRYCDFILDGYLDNYQLRNLFPSLIAASVLSTSRIALSMTKQFVLVSFWPKEYQKLTGYKWEELQDITEILLLPFKVNNSTCKVTSRSSIFADPSPTCINNFHSKNREN